MQADAYIATTVATTLLARLTRTHERRRISVFSGPPGIGKSTAIERFRQAHDGEVAVVELEPGPRTGHKSLGALKYALEAVAEITPRRFHTSGYGVSTVNFVELRRRFYNLACDWGGLSPDRFRKLPPLGEAPPLTIVFDEAQHLARDGIEALRTLNSDQGTYAPFPLGLAFVGNNDFQLRADRRTGMSVLTDAVSDRLLYHELFEYGDVKDSDLSMFLEAGGLVEPEGLRLALRYFSSELTARSFRRVEDFLAHLKERCGHKPITADVVRSVLCLP